MTATEVGSASGSSVLSAGVIAVTAVVLVAILCVVNRQALARKAQLSDQDIELKATALFSCFHVGGGDRQVKFEVPSYRSLDFGTEEVSDVDWFKIVANLIDRGLMSNAASSSILGGIWDLTFYKAPKYLIYTETGWNMHTALINRQYGRGPDVKNDNSIRTTIKAGRKAKVKVGDINSHNTTGIPGRLEDVISLAERLVSAIRVDARTLEPQTRGVASYLANELAASIPASQEGLADSDDSQSVTRLSRIRERVAEVVRWLPTVGTGMEETRKIIDTLNAT